MSSGDEPMLSQPESSNDVRTAYLAGNLFALMGRMNKGQCLRFQQAIVRLLLWHFERSSKYESCGSEEHQGLDYIRRWLDDPNPEHGRSARHVLLGNPIVQKGDERLLSELGAAQLLEVQRYRNLTPGSTKVIVFDIACAISSAAVYGLEEAAIRVMVKITQQKGGNIRGIIWPWMLNAAWAILHDQEPPPIPDLTTWASPD